MSTKGASIEKKRKNWIIQLIVWSITLLIYIMVTCTNTIESKIKGISIIYTLYIPFTIWLLILMFQKGKLKKELIKVLMETSLEEFKNFKFDIDMGIPEKIFIESEFIKKYTNYYSSNYVYGTLENNCGFRISDIVVTKQERDLKGNKHTYTLYKGIFSVLEKNKCNEFDLIIMPDVKNKYVNQVFGSIKKMVGKKDIVRLENVEFERYFEVYSDNGLEARKIITVEFMEKLLILRKKLGKALTIIYKNNKVYLYASKANIVSEVNLLFKGITVENIINTRKTLQNIYEVMELL